MKSINNKNEKIISFNNNEALVFYEWLVNFNNKDFPDLINHESEQIILWNIEALMETLISETFEDNYLKKLNDARKSIS